MPVHFFLAHQMPVCILFRKRRIRRKQQHGSYLYLCVSTKFKCLWYLLQNQLPVKK